MENKGGVSMNCNECGNEFIPKSGHQIKYCSDKCRKKHDRIKYNKTHYNCIRKVKRDILYQNRRSGFKIALSRQERWKRDLWGGVRGVAYG